MWADLMVGKMVALMVASLAFYLVENSAVQMVEQLAGPKDGMKVALLADWKAVELEYSMVVL